LLAEGAAAAVVTSLAAALPVAHASEGNADAIVMAASAAVPALRTVLT
jgi:hypothetical protein